MNQEVEKMLRMGVIQPSKSEWCSLVVLVPKKDGSTRFCIDFRKLNGVAKFDAYPTSRIDDLQCTGFTRRRKVHLISGSN